MSNRGVGLIVILAAAAIGCRPAPLPEEARVASARWLMTDCGAEEQGNIESVFARHKTELEPFFLEQLKHGPSSQALAGCSKARTS